MTADGPINQEMAVPLASRVGRKAPDTHRKEVTG